MSGLDTSGHVMVDALGFAWPDLTPITQGYVEALFADICADPDFHAEWPGFYTPAIAPKFTDLAPPTLERIIADCANALGSQLWGNSLGDGRIFWAERGEGFSAFAGDQPSILVSQFPPLAVSIGDDGKVYLRPISLGLAKIEREEALEAINPTSVEGG